MDADGMKTANLVAAGGQAARDPDGPGVFGSKCSQYPITNLMLARRHAAIMA
ncbi:MAG: hypothetical protein ACREFX_11770 [Opitutaceae bacterium]